jgi:polyhydroxybutyrate depolymerase
LHHCRWITHADQAGFAVVAPEGTPPNRNEKPSFRFNPQLWNLGTPSTAAPTDNSDDVGFVRALLKALPEYMNVDQSRLYACGFSNGAGLTFHLAVELGERWAAIAPIAGYPYLKNGPPPRAIPFYYLVGSVDPLIPLHGGDIVSPWTGETSHRAPILPALEQWRELSGFDPAPCSREREHATRPVMGEEITLGKAPNGEVMKYQIVPGLGHHWPGGKNVGVPESVLGPRIKTFDATERLWTFFSQYRLPEQNLKHSTR